MGSTAASIGRAASSRRRAPARGWYWAAIVIAVLGVGLGITWGVLSTIEAHDRAGSLPRTTVPGTLDVRLEAGTSRLVYFEGDGKPGLDALGLTVIAPDGSAVHLDEYDLLLEYEIAGWMGKPVATFYAPSTGTYEVSAAMGSAGEHISVGDNFLRSQALDIVAALVLIVASIAVAAVIAVVVAVKRSQVARA